MPTLALGPAWRRLRERHDAPVARRLYERARDFVGDLTGRPRGPYLTFRDGWRFQEAFDTIRAAHGWTAIPT